MINVALTNHDPSFSIRIDPPSKFVEIHMKGFWGEAEFARFNTTLRAMLPALPAGGCAIGEQVTLFDLTAYQVQSQAVFVSLAQMASDQEIGSRRIAIVLSSGLLKLQARRAAPGYEMFQERGSAMRWLQELA